MTCRLIPLLATLAALLATACGSGEAPTGPRTVLLISIDTLRPDRLGVYGGSEGVSPRIDALAAEATVYDRAVASAPWTLPSHMSMLTGLDPIAHGVKRGNVVLSQHVNTLAEILLAEGFRTAAFTDGGFVSGTYGFSQGFEIYDDKRNPDGPNGFTRLLPMALDWMSQHENEDYFLFVHSFDVHAPYFEGDQDVLEEFRARSVEPDPIDYRMHWTNYFHQQQKMGMSRYVRVNELLNDYDAGVFEADRGVGRLLDGLAAAGRLDNALVIVTSDHGEAMLERGLHIGHGIALTDDELAIPMIIRFPGGDHAGRRIDTSVDLVDLAPTALGVYGIEPDTHMQGDSLHALASGARRRREYLLAHSANTERYALIRNDYKYISPLGLHSVAVAERHLGVHSPPNPARQCETYNPGGDPDVELCYDAVGDPLAVRDHLPHHEMLFHRLDDPTEQQDLSGKQADISQRMRSFLLTEALKRSEQIYTDLFDIESEPPPFDPHQEHQLAQLGYLDTGAKAEFIDMSRAMRDETRNPHEPPDMSGIEAIDRDVHEIRLAIQAKTSVPDLEDKLYETGFRYVAWAVENDDPAQPKWWPRIAWRLFELKALGEQADIDLDDTVWWKRSLDLRGMPSDTPRGRKAGSEDEPGAGDEGR